MSNNIPLYRAVHAETGEELVGTARELAEKLGVTNITISKFSLQGTKAKGFKIYKLVSDGHENNFKFTKDILDEWEEVTKPFKEASRRYSERCI